MLYECSAQVVLAHISHMQQRMRRTLPTVIASGLNDGLHRDVESGIKCIVCVSL